MTRALAVIGVLAVLFAASRAGAEESEARQSVPASPAQADAPGPDGVAAQADEGPDFEPLAEDELAALEEAAARDPGLADKAGGYVSNDELLTILLVVLIVVIVIP